MGELKGRQLQPREIARLCYDAGWQDAQILAVAVAVCLAESQGYDHAQNTNPDGTVDRGIWQLNSIHKSITDAIAYDPVKATDAAANLYLSEGSSFSPWAAYNSGVYLHDSYIGRAVQGVGNYLGAELLSYPVPEHPDGTPYVHRFTTPILNFQHRLSGCLNHLDRGRTLLGWQAATKGRVYEVQTELAKGHLAASATLPQS